MWTDKQIRSFTPKENRYRLSDDLGQRGAGKLILDIHPNGKRFFFFQYYRKKATHSKRVLVKIGPYKSRLSASGFTLVEAREKALAYSKQAMGGDLKKQLKSEAQKLESEEKLESIAAVTLQEALDGYIDNKDLKPGTIYDYRKSMAQTFAKYLNKPITEIDRETILYLYRQRTKKSVARANNAMRVFRAVYNYQRAITRLTAGAYLIPENPYDILREARVIRKLPRRKGYLPREDLKKWFEAIFTLDDTRFSSGTTVRDLLIFLLLTGTRRDEARTIKRKHINLRRGVFSLKDTKNREVVELPMSDYLKDMISRRMQLIQGEYIFEGLNPEKPIVSFKRPLEYLRDEHQLQCTMHDLRRTFVTIAESLDISGYTIKRLVNHKLDSDNDVTAGYMIIDIDRMRVATQKITDAILGYAQLNSTPTADNVIPLRPKSKTQT